MMDIANILTRKYPGLKGWQVVDRGKGEVIEEWPTGKGAPPKPTTEQLQIWWVEEIALEIEHERIAAERERRYRQETDGLLYDAFAEMELPELTEWKQAREAIKSELAYPSKEVVIKR